MNFPPPLYRVIFTLRIEMAEKDLVSETYRNQEAAAGAEDGPGDTEDIDDALGSHGHGHERQQDEAPEKSQLRAIDLACLVADR